MRDFWKCIIYLALAGILGFSLGRLLPKKWFRADRFPYRSFRLEKDGKVYLKLKVRKWQNKIPDMSKILPGLMPPKAISPGYGPEELALMVQETCVAEMIHALLSVAGLFCVRLWEGWGGVILAVLYFAGNLPFIIVQRFNRPRLQKLRARLERGGRGPARQEDE